MYMHVYKNNVSVHAIDGAGKHFVACSRAAYVAIQVFKGAVRRNIFYTISILFESTFHTSASLLYGISAVDDVIKYLICFF